MHHALLIDEILQLVLDHCEDLPGVHPRWTYAQLARCCRAWKDPALDRLWARLAGVGPLMALREGDAAVPSETLRAYAARVKSVTYEKRPAKGACDEGTVEDDVALQGPAVLPNLESVTLSFDGCLTPPSLALSPRLAHLTIHTGVRLPTAPDQVLLDRANAAARLLARAATSLRTLHIRGRMSDALNAAVASARGLRTLRLRVHGRACVAPETLAAVAAFPALEVLEVHALSISAGAFEGALPPNLASSSPSSPALASASSHGHAFPALTHLDIRADAALLVALLVRLPVGVLRVFRADVAADARGGAARMVPVFQLLAAKAAGSLRELALEDCTELHELDGALPRAAPLVPDDAASNSAAVAASGQCEGQWYTPAHLAPLAALTQLRALALPHPDLADGDLATLGKWWPHLTHLRLGTLDADADANPESEGGSESMLPSWKVRMTPGAYAAAARAFPYLASLALPAHPPASIAETWGKADSEQARVAHEALRELAVGEVPAGEAQAVGTVEALRALFPRLERLESPAGPLADRWEAVRHG